MEARGREPGETERSRQKIEQGKRLGFRIQREKWVKKKWLQVEMYDWQAL